MLPADNTSPDINAAHRVTSLVMRPLTEASYYVFPVAVVEETFQQNGLTSATDAQAVSAAIKQMWYNVSDKAHTVAGLTSHRLLAQNEQGRLLTGPRYKLVSAR